ncbi:MAG TPA: hypothetical protein VH274_00515 [Mycobacteriales bacterium]|nr:hypothetical protein [Mycobacteriales bacterium]
MTEKRVIALSSAAAVVSLVTALGPSSAATATPLALGPIVRVVSPGTSPCPDEGEPEVTQTRLGTWVAYNDARECPALPTTTRIEEVQLVPPHGPSRFIPLEAALGHAVGPDPALAPAPDGGVYLAGLETPSTHLGAVSLQVLHVNRHLHVVNLPSPSLHGRDNFDDKEFIAVDDNPASLYVGHLYVAWDDYDLGQVVLRTWDGVRWSKPVMLQGNAGAPDVAVGPDGTIAVAMRGPSRTGAVVRISHDGGRHFDRAVTAIKGLPPGRLDLACPTGRATVGFRQRVILGARLAFDANADLHVVATIGSFVGDVSRKLSAGPAIVAHAVLRDGRLLHSERVTRPTTDDQWEASVAPLPTGGAAVSWLQTNGAARDTYDAWIAVEGSGARTFASPQRLSPTSSPFPAAPDASTMSDCYGIGDYIGMTATPHGVATVWPTTDTDTPSVESDILLRTATPR